MARALKLNNISFLISSRVPNHTAIKQFKYNFFDRDVYLVKMRTQLYI